jgi:hypothetical protein
MEAMNCQACRIEIEEAEGDEALSARARAHAETCLSCRTFRIERQSLRRLVGSLETVAAPPDFDFRLRARLGAAGQEDRRRLAAWPGFAPGTSAIALAASLALVIGAAIIFKQINFNRPETTGSTEATATTHADGTEPGRVASTPPPIMLANSPTEETAAHHKDTAQSNLTAAARRRASVDVVRERKLNIERKATASVPDDNDPGISSIDFGGLNPSPQVYPTGIYNPAVDPSPSIIVPLRALARPAKFLFDEGRAASPVFSLRNVTFGSEKLIEHSKPSGAAAADASDIW